MSVSEGNYRRHREKLFRHHAGICWLCGESGADEVDHLVPQAQGGSDDYVNLRPAHGSCNRDRNRKSHKWHRAPEVSIEGFPSDWNGEPLSSEHWRDDWPPKLKAVEHQAMIHSGMTDPVVIAGKKAELQELLQSLPAAQSEVDRAEKLLVSEQAVADARSRELRNSAKNCEQAIRAVKIRLAAYSGGIIGLGVVITLLGFSAGLGNEALVVQLFLGVLYGSILGIPFYFIASNRSTDIRNLRERESEFRAQDSHNRNDLLSLESRVRVLASQLRSQRTEIRVLEHWLEQAEQLRVTK